MAKFNKETWYRLSIKIWKQKYDIFFDLETSAAPDTLDKAFRKGEIQARPLMTV